MSEARSTYRDGVAVWFEGLQVWGLLVGAFGLGCSISLANIGWISAAVALIIRLVIRQTRWVRLPLLWPIIGILAASTLSGLLGAQPLESLREVWWEDDILLLIVLVVGQTAAERPALTMRLLGWFLAGSAFSALFGLAQYGLQIEGRFYGIHPVGVPRWLAWLPERAVEYLALADWRVKGPRSMPSTFSEGLVFAMVAAGALAWTMPVRRRRMAGLLLLMGLGVVLSETRGAWLGAAAGLAAMALIGGRRPLLSFGVAVAAVGLLLLLWPRQTTSARRFRTIASPAAWQADPSIRWRLEMWRTGAAMGRDFPVFGVGVGNVSRLYPAYRRPGEGGRVWGDVHSDALNRWVERGIVGIAAWIWFMAAHLRSSWRAGGWIRLVAGGLWAASLGMGLTETTLGDAEIFMDLCFLVGLTQPGATAGAAT